MFKRIYVLSRPNFSRLQSSKFSTSVEKNAASVENKVAETTSTGSSLVERITACIVGMAAGYR